LHKRQLVEKVGIFFFIIFLLSNNVCAQDEGMDYEGYWAEQPIDLHVNVLKEKIREQNKGLFDCRLYDPSMEFLCNPDWETQKVQGTTIIKVSVDPYVAMSVSRVSSDIVYVEQLSHSFFEERKLYEKGFTQDFVKLAGMDAVQVKAFSKREPDMRFLSYFFFHKGTLYNILFSVYPKERWEEYKFLFKRIKNSFKLEERKDI